MPVFGVVLVLDSAADEVVAEAVSALRARADVDLGDLVGNRLPIVLDCVAGRTTSDAALRDLESMPRVAHIEVVYSDFEDLVTPVAPESRIANPVGDGERKWT
jgi:hypothetical protein